MPESLQLNRCMTTLKFYHLQTRIRAVSPADLGAGFSFEHDNIGGKGVNTAHQVAPNAVCVDGYLQFFELGDAVRIEPSGDNYLNMLIAMFVQRPARHLHQFGGNAGRVEILHDGQHRFVDQGVGCVQSHPPESVSQGFTAF